MATVTETDPAERIAGPDRVIRRQSTLPGGRAVVGGLLIALAAVLVFVAYANAGSGPSDEVVVAARDLRLGQTISASDLRVAAADLPAGSRGGAFRSIDDVAGRVALGPVGEGEIVQAGAVSRRGGGAGNLEVEIRLPRERVAVGRLSEGERVDVFVTYGDRTRSVVRGVPVVQISSDGDGSLGGEREVSLVVAVPSGDVVAAVVHALRTGEVTVVRATFAGGSDQVLEHVEPEAAAR